MIESEDHAHGKVSEMTRRSRMNHPFMMWCIAYAQSTNWTTVPDGLLTLAKRAFRGWLQSRIVEKANKVVRECEQRDQNNKVLVLLSSRCFVRRVAGGMGEF